MKRKDGEVKKILSTLTMSNLKILQRLMNSRERAGFPLGQKEGASFGTLSKKGLIERFAKEGMKQRWRITDGVFTLDDRTFLKELLGISRK